MFRRMSDRMFDRMFEGAVVRVATAGGAGLGGDRHVLATAVLRRGLYGSKSALNRHRRRARLAHGMGIETANTFWNRLDNPSIIGRERKWRF